MKLIEEASSNALEANPKIEQFWLSYIDALIKTEKLDEAKKAIVDANQAGIAAAKLQIFEEQLQSELSPSSDLPQQKFGNQLRSHQDELSAAIELREVGKYKEAQEWLSNLLNMTLETQKLYHCYPKCSCWIKKRRKRRER